MYNSMIFSKFIEWSDYNHNSVLEHFHHPQNIFCVHLWSISPPLPKRQATINLLKLLLMDLLTLRVYKTRILRLGHSYTAQNVSPLQGTSKPFAFQRTQVFLALWILTLSSFPH